MVTYDRTSIKLRFIGHFGASTTARDYWSAGLRLAVVGGGAVSTADLTPFLETISTPVATFHNDGPVGAGSTTYLDELNAAHLGTNGKYISSAELTARRAYTTPIVGAGAGIHPWNTAFVSSLRTLQARGLASNGRMYYPATGLAVDASTGRVNATLQGNYATSVQTLLQAINSAAQSYQSGLRVHVLGWSAKHGTNFSSLVTSVRVDNRLDSIERRENDQLPVWVTRTV
jgi:hypothetical protein